MPEAGGTQVQANLLYIARLCLKKKKYMPDLVAHPCNPIYSGGRDQEDCSSRPARAKVRETPNSINKS
jgi:hypothetical protein